MEDEDLASQTLLEEMNEHIHSAHLARVLGDSLLKDIAKQAEIVDAMEREIHHDLKDGCKPDEWFIQQRGQAREQLARLLSKLRIRNGEDTPLDHDDPHHAMG